MFLISCNSHVKLWRNKKRSAKSNKNKPFLNRYNREGIDFLSEKN